MKKSIYTAPEIFVTEAMQSVEILQGSKEDGTYGEYADTNEGSFEEDEAFFNGNSSLWDE